MREVNIWFFFIRKHFPTGSSKVGMLSRSASQKKEFLFVALTSDAANISACAHQTSSSPDPPDPTGTARSNCGF